MTALEQWLEYAPKAGQLKSGQKWHVFLSYRSVNRSWVLQLYDVLRHLGYEVFLDQYVLAASTHLVGGLEEGLAMSGSGVLIWSTSAADSRWCTKEYQTMEARATGDPDFHYVVAKLDRVQLPLLAGHRLYLDFSDYRGGPSGLGLLKLLYGIRGEALPNDAVKFATRVDEEARASMGEIRGALDNGNHRKLVALANSSGVAWVTTPVLGCEVVESLIKLKRYDDALAAVSVVHQRFSKAIRPVQLTGLAQARKGDWRAAQDTLDNLVASGEQDPETLGIYARTWMDRYAESQNRLHLERSRDLYAQAFDNAPSDYYTGINAAAKSVFLGDLQAAAGYAERLEKIVEPHRYEGDYWKTATAAEIQLIKRNYDAAARLYKAAVVMAPEEHGSHETTWLQAQRLMERLAPEVDERAKVAAAFAHLQDPAQPAR